LTTKRVRPRNFKNNIYLHRSEMGMTWVRELRGVAEFLEFGDSEGATEVFLHSFMLKLASLCKSIFVEIAFHGRFHQFSKAIQPLYCFEAMSSSYAQRQLWWAP
jgi:hypothetical protein